MVPMWSKVPIYILFVPKSQAYLATPAQQTSLLYHCLPKNNSSSSSSICSRSTCLYFLFGDEGMASNADFHETVSPQNNLFPFGFDDEKHSWVVRPPETYESSLSVVDNRGEDGQQAKAMMNQNARTYLTPNIEAEVLTDLAHVVMDFSIYLTPSKSVIRIGALMGRMLVLLADYLPDHSIRPEEFVIQLFMMAVTVEGLLTQSKRFHDQHET